MNDNYNQPQGTTSREDEVPTILPNERLSKELSTPRHDKAAEAKARKDEAILEAHAAIEKAISWAMMLAEEFEKERQRIDSVNYTSTDWVIRHETIGDMIATINQLQAGVPTNDSFYRSCDVIKIELVRKLGKDAPWRCPICTDGKPHHHKAVKEIHCSACGNPETLITYA